MNVPRKPIYTKHAPAAIGPYSQAIAANGFLFISGQTPIDPATGQLIEGDIAAQTHRVLENLSAILAAAGASLDDIVKTTVFLHDMDDFVVMNTVYAQRFSGAPPARSTVGNLNLPRGAQVEIEAIALLPDRPDRQPQSV